MRFGVHSTTAILIGILASGVAAATSAAGAPRPGPSCSGFMQDFPKTLGDTHVTFERPLTITRDLLGNDDGVDVHIMASSVDVDGTLKCKGDAFRRFEVRIAAPPEADTLDNLSRFEQGALMTMFGWDRGKAGVVIKAMGTDAAEYLQASIQRGDAFHAGKVEYHQGSQYDIGLIWTDTDYTFIVTSQDDS